MLLCKYRRDIQYILLGWQNTLGFDIGPGNVFLDDFVKIFYNKSYDVDGEIASRGHYIQEIIESFFQDSLEYLLLNL